VRVALVCPYAWDLPGGVQAHVRELAGRLTHRGHDVVVLAPARSTSSAEAGVRIVGSAVRVPFNGSVAPIAPDPRSGRRVRRELRAFGPDVIHVHEPFAPSASLFAVLGAAPVPVVATFHADAGGNRVAAAAAPLLRRVWDRVDVRVAVSEAAAAFGSARFGGAIRVIPNGVDVERFVSARPIAGLPQGRRVLFLGRLEPRKGFRTAVTAFELVSAEFPDLHLVVVGDGGERGAVDGLAPSVRGRVLMRGVVSEDDKPGHFAAADVFVAPATGGESFGIVLVEAMAAGAPVVASDIAGYRDVAGDRNQGGAALLVPPEDPPALARAVRRVLADPGLAADLRQAGQIRAARFDWSVVTGEIEGAYEEAVRRRRR
jgi:phosphatidyl-myo-inositol alpha-mannosyltransferase